MRYDFVERHRETWPVRLMCRVLRVSPGGYYDWRGRPQSLRAARHDALVVANKAIHGEVKSRYGRPRIHAELVARGEPCCVNTVAGLMRTHGIAAKTRRKFRCTTDSNHGRPVADNVLDRQFEPVAANLAWTADITYVATAEAGSTWRSSRTSTPGGSWAGRWASGSTAGWSLMPWRWRSPGGCRAQVWWPTRTGAASTPASTTSGSWPATGSYAA